MAQFVSPSPDVVIVGGGVIGAITAYELARRGVAVTLVERGELGTEASGASAGILNIPSRPEWPAARVSLLQASLRRYPALLDELQAITDIDLEWMPTGEIAVAVDAAAATARAELVAWQRGLGYAITHLSPDEARAQEPHLPETLAGTWRNEVASVLSVRRLTEALATAAAHHGATILTNSPVGSLSREGDRITGVRLLDRDIVAGTVLLATGAWTRFLGQAVSAALPTRPVKGQVLAFARSPLRPKHIISGHGGYVRPRPDGTTIVAATEEPAAGFDQRVSGGGVAWLLNLTRTLYPALLAVEIAQTWAGLRPGTDSGQPLLGPVPGLTGLWVATGHFRTGAVEAPATGELLATALTGGEALVLAEFAPPAAESGTAPA